MRPEPIVPGKWLVPLLVLLAFGMVPALWPVHGLGVLLASLVLRLGVSAVLLYFTVRYFRRNGLRGPHAR